MGNVTCEEKEMGIALTRFADFPSEMECRSGVGYFDGGMFYAEIPPGQRHVGQAAVFVYGVYLAFFETGSHWSLIAR